MLSKLLKSTRSQFHSSLRYASTCKAILQNSFGSSDVLEISNEYEFKRPIKKEILVEVYGSSVNPLDCQQREGIGKTFFEVITRENVVFPICPGCEFAGKVIEAGSNSSYKVGDRVYGTSMTGRSWAEKICIDESCVAFAPNTIPLHIAGTFPKVAISVAGFIKATKMKPKDFVGKRVFINGGSGGVGTFTTQLLKAYGAEEIAVTCGPNNMEFCSELGATTVVNYKKDDYREVLRDFDIYVDCINSDDEDRRSGYKILRKGGHYLTLVFPWMENTDELGMFNGTVKTLTWFVKMKRDAWRNFGIRFDTCIGTPDRKFLEETADMIDAGQIKPVVSATFSLDEMKKAHDIIDSGRAKGKLGIIIKEEDLPSV